MKKIVWVLCFTWLAGCATSTTDEQSQAAAGENNSETEQGIENAEETEVNPQTEAEALNNEETSEATDPVESPVDPAERTETEGPVEVQLDTQFAVRTDINLDENVYAITAGQEDSVLICGQSNIYKVSEENGAVALLEASCDALVLMDDRLYFNSRKNGEFFYVELGNDSLEVTTVMTNDDSQAIRNFHIWEKDDGTTLLMSQGSAGVGEYNPQTDSFETLNKEDLIALHVAAIPGTKTVVIGTTKTIRMLNGTEETTLASGSADFGWFVEGANGAWNFASANPIGFSTMTALAGNVAPPTVDSTMKPGGQPFVIREGIATSWSELLALDWETDESGAPLLKITGRYSKTYNVPGRTVHRHYVDVLDRDGDTIIAAHDKGVTWFDLKTQGAEPDITTDALVLKMSPYEAGGPATGIIVLRNNGEADLVVTDITVDNEKFSWVSDSLVDSETPEELMVLAPGDSSYFNVEFVGGEGAEVARVSISTNDPDEPQIDVTARVNYPNVGPGHHIPSILIPDASGKLHSLADWSGMVLYAKFFNGVCVHCAHELPFIVHDYLPNYAADGFQAVIVHVGNELPNGCKLADEYEGAFPLLLDSDNTLLDVYQQVGPEAVLFPLGYLVDQDNTVQYIYNDPNDLDEVTESPASLLDDVEELLGL